VKDFPFYWFDSGHLPGVTKVSKRILSWDWHLLRQHWRSNIRYYVVFIWAYQRILPGKSALIYLYLFRAKSTYWCQSERAILLHKWNVNECIFCDAVVHFAIVPVVSHSLVHRRAPLSLLDPMNQGFRPSKTRKAAVINRQEVRMIANYRIF